MCNYANDVPPEYFCATTPQGARVDREQRPELMRGTVEFLVPKEYWNKEPVGLRWLFLIDVGQEAFNKGYLEAFCEGIVAALYGGDQSLEEDGRSKRRIPEGSKVGFVTFDKDIHFYNMNPALDQAQMMIMPDIEEPFVPLSEGLFVDPYEAK
jgi:protein transport protein SEC24